MSSKPERKTHRETCEDSEDESEFLEESPCGRWQTRREKIDQSDVPGIDSAYLAMDTEEGVEVVWNEVRFSENINLKTQIEQTQIVFEKLIQLEHPNIIKFHKYWTDNRSDHPRVIYITEYMSSGSLKQFLKRTKRNVKRLSLPAWKRWCTQILSALNYLHSCTPPIVHGNLTCDSIFIQHNGIVKIGSVAPDAIHDYCKLYDMKNKHFIAPEQTNRLTPAVDVYSFGMCALEMATLEIQTNGNSNINEKTIQDTIHSLEDSQQQNFIHKCLEKNPTIRPHAGDLLFHPLLFEVHSLKFLAAHCLVKNIANIPLTNLLIQKLQNRSEIVIAEIVHPSGQSHRMRLVDIPLAEKFVEDLKIGIYPWTSFALKQPPLIRLGLPEVTESMKSFTEPMNVESRKIVNMLCNVKPNGGSGDLLMTILLRMDDKMNRQLRCTVARGDTPEMLAAELVHFGFVNEGDREKIMKVIDKTIKSVDKKSAFSSLNSNQVKLVNSNGKSK